MFLQTIIITPTDIGYGVNGTIVFVILVFTTIAFVKVNVSQNINELFLCVGNIPQQFVVEPKNTGTVFICVSRFIGFHMVSQIFLHSFQFFQNIRVNGSPNSLCDCRPGVDLRQSPHSW